MNFSQEGGLCGFDLGYVCFFESQRLQAIQENGLYKGLVKPLLLFGVVGLAFPYAGEVLEGFFCLLDPILYGWCWIEVIS